MTDRRDFVDRAVHFLRQWRRLFQATEALLVDNISATAPWLAPVPSAYMMYHSMNAALDFPAWAAFVGGAVVELLGLSAVTTVIGLWEYNEHARQRDQRAPVVLALITAGFYLAVVLTVNALLDPGEPIARLSKGLISCLSVVAGVILALRSGQAKRTQAIEDERAERRAARMAQVGARYPQEAQVAEVAEVAEKLRDWRQLSPGERARIAGMTPAQIRSVYPGLPERTSEAWAARGRNGHGDK